MKKVEVIASTPKIQAILTRFISQGTLTKGLPLRIQAPSTEIKKYTEEGLPISIGAHLWFLLQLETFKK